MTRRRGRPTPPPIRSRTGVVGLVLALATIGLVARLATIQVVDADRWADRLDGQLVTSVPLPAARGAILDRTGALLAASVSSASVYVDPRTFRAGGGDPFTAAEQLAAILDLDPFDVHTTLTADSSFAYLARQRDRAVGDQVEALGHPGVVVVDEPVRTYPAGLIAPGIVGLVDVDGVGITGLESALQDRLAGVDGHLRVNMAPDGTPIPGDRDEQRPVAGDDVTLTLDTYLQATAQQVAADVVELHDADDASVVVLEVGTGRVLAAATAPSGARRDVDATIVRPVVEQFEPGSVMKVVTVAAALEHDMISATGTVGVPARLPYGGHTFRDSHDHPVQAWGVIDILERSSNVGTIMLADMVGPDRLHDMLVDFGVGTSPGTGLRGEAAGSLLPPDAWSATSLPTIAIGQGVALSALQVADVYATVANGGVRVAPRIVDAVGGQATARPDPVRVISPDTAATVTAGLVAVVDGEHGTGAAAAVDGVTVAGKTGTARRPSPDGGYADYVATFAGFAPAEDPQVAVVVTVDRPTASSIYGGTVAAPAWADMTGFALTYLRTAAPGQATPATTR